MENKISYTKFSKDVERWLKANNLPWKGAKGIKMINSYLNDKYEILEKHIKEIATSKCSLMNNSKWNKLFKAIENSNVSVVHGFCQILRETDKLYPISLEVDSNYPCFIRDGYNVVRLSHINFIVIKVKNNEDLDKIITSINQAGNFDFEKLDKSSLKTLGIQINGWTNRYPSQNCLLRTVKRIHKIKL